MFIQILFIQIHVVGFRYFKTKWFRGLEQQFSFFLWARSGFKQSGCKSPWRALAVRCVCTYRYSYITLWLFRCGQWFRIQGFEGRRWSVCLTPMFYVDHTLYSPSNAVPTSSFIRHRVHKSHKFDKVVVQLDSRCQSWCHWKWFIWGSVLLCQHMTSLGGKYGISEERWMLFCS